GRVDSLCTDISNILVSQPGLLRTGSFQSQSQSSGGTHQHQTAGGSSFGSSSLFAPDPNSNWWPQDLGSPSATGSQNNARYAYFADSRRLAVDTSGDVWVYDTQDHHIGGFSQQQGSGGSITFTSQYGTVNLSSLRAVSRNGRPVESSPAGASGSFGSSSSHGHSASPSSQGGASGRSNESDVFAALEKLGDLKAKGILTDAEFNAKKAELLSRL
ncbi:MAG TPA: SHOCT domain-containing protein, partial [Pirellulales bacterium]